MAALYFHNNLLKIELDELRCKASMKEVNIKYFGSSSQVGFVYALS